MRRFAVVMVPVAVVPFVVLVVLAAHDTRAQVMPTPRGQLGGRMPLGTQAPSGLPAVTPTATASPGGHPAIGSWIVNVAAGAVTEPPRLYTFAADGTLLVSTAAGSTGHGAWTATGGRTAAFTVVFLRVDGGGAYAGTTTFRGTLEVDATGNAWSRSSLNGEQARPDGSVTGTSVLPPGPLQLKATRIRP